MACIYLHNFLRKSKTSNNLYYPQNTLDKEVNGQIIFGTWRNDTEMSSLFSIKKVPRKSPTRAQQIREVFSGYFLSNGTIPWQNEYA